MSDAAPFDSDFAQALLHAFAPPADTPVAEWVEANVWLPSETNARPGALKPFAYQRAVLDLIGNPKVERIVLMLPAQVGKSAAAIAVLLYVASATPGNILVLLPTESDAASWLKTTLMPIVTASGMAKDVKVTSSTSLEFKSGAHVYCASSYRAADVAARACRLVISDEVDRHAKSALTAGSRHGEGPAFILADRRGATYKSRGFQHLIISTPTRTDASVIAQEYAASTAERWSIPCEGCGVFWAPTIDALRYDPRDIDATVRLHCSECHEPHTEQDIFRVTDQGCFVATNPSPSPKSRSCHMTELVSRASSISNVARQHLAAQGDEERLRVFRNTSLAETADDAGFAIESTSLRDRAEQIGPILPKAVAYLTAGIDVQIDRAEMLVMAHSIDGERWIISRQVFPGDVYNAGPWAALSIALRQEHRTVDGRVLKLAMTFCDAGNFRSQVHRFVAASQPRLHATFGKGSFDGPLVKQSQERIVGPLKSLMLNVSQGKLALMRGLANSEPGTPGYIHIPLLNDDSFYDELVSERLETTFDKKGFAKRAWVKRSRSQRNEALDMAVYALLASTLVSHTALNKPRVTPAEAASRLAALSTSHERPN